MFNVLNQFKFGVQLQGLTKGKSSFTVLNQFKFGAQHGLVIGKGNLNVLKQFKFGAQRRASAVLFWGRRCS